MSDVIHVCTWYHYDWREYSTPLQQTICGRQLLFPIGLSASLPHPVRHSQQVGTADWAAGNEYTFALFAFATKILTLGVRAKHQGNRNAEYLVDFLQSVRHEAATDLCEGGFSNAFPNAFRNTTARRDGTAHASSNGGVTKVISA